MPRYDLLSTSLGGGSSMRTKMGLLFLLLCCLVGSPAQANDSINKPNIPDGFGCGSNFSDGAVYSTGQPVRHQRRTLAAKEGFDPSLGSSKDLSSGHNCQREKTLGTLPTGAPLPDIQIPQNDTITAEHAYETAKKLLTNNCQIDATEYFERAIGALRKKRGTYSKKLGESIVVDYGQLLRAHLGARKATELEIEFLSE
jgi:hypothetical protein